MEAFAPQAFRFLIITLKGNLMKYYKVDFDPDYAKKEGCEAKGRIYTELINDDRKAYKAVKDYLAKALEGCLRESVGGMKYKFVVPGAEYQDLWDWDAFFMCCALPDDKLEYAKGSIMGLLDGTTDYGKPTKKVSYDGHYLWVKQSLPVLVQFTYIVAKRLGDFSWVAPYWEKLENIAHYNDRNYCRGGFYVWHTLSGIDNNPSNYGQMNNSVAGADLASWIYREFRAMAKLSSALGKGREDYYLDRAKKLKEFIQENYFDYTDEFFYDIHLNFPGIETADICEQGVKWHNYLKFRNFANLFVLWGKTASEAQAEKVMRRVMSPDEYLAPCGIRSHSKADMVYNNIPMGNPSNWQGPVWGLTSFLTAYSMLHYGYKKEALEVAWRMVRTFAADIAQNGCIHEFYNGDNGQPVIRPYFLSWNLLGIRIIDDLENGVDCTTLDILD